MSAILFGSISTVADASDKLALVTTTARENVDALLDGLDDVSAEEFDVIIDAASVEDPKPDKYTLALQTLGVDAGTAVAIEDNVIGLASAKAAGVRRIAFPNANTADRVFDAADQRVDRLDPDALISAA